jgi:site-specific recombinase XerD
VPGILAYGDAYVAELERTERHSTHHTTRGIVKKLRKYLKGKDILLSDINVEFLKKYERHLESLGNRANTIHNNIKLIRKLLNDAIREDLIEQTPFSKFSTKQERTTKRYLVESELALLEKYEMNFGTKRCAARDMFLFSVYAGGLRVSDLITLKSRSLGKQLERANVVTRKTGSEVTIKLTAKAKALLDKYRKPDSKLDDFVFPCMLKCDERSEAKTVKAIKSATAYINKNLSYIAEQLEIEHFSIHAARHTFATLALKRGMRLEYVGKLMGHENLKTTQVYAKIINSELDKAMDLME